MRIYSVMPNYQAKNIRKTNNIQQTNQTAPTAMSVTSQRTMPGVLLTFTGNDDKHIREFASYAPENKRFGYMAGGLGVVTQEAPVSWRLHENADVRDFAPYHAYDNGDGGVKAVIVRKDANGKYITSYNQDEFYHAAPNETLEQLMKRENIQLKDGEEFRFVVQRKPNDKGISNVIVLDEATDLKGSVTRPSTKSISKMETIPYRVFRAISVADTVDEKIDKYKQSLFNELKKPYIEKYNKEVREKYKDEYAQAEQKDNGFLEQEKKEIKKKKENNPQIDYKPHVFNEERNKVEAKIKKEVEQLVNSDKELKEKYEAKLNTDEVKKQIEAITSKAAPNKAERNAAYFIHTEGLARFESPYGSEKAYYSRSAKVKVNGKLEEIKTDLAYADSNRAFVDVLPKMNTEKHGFYNPANIWLHDRPGFMVMNYIADESYFGNNYWNGVKADGRFHNPGRSYQGAEDNPFEFFRMSARKEDVDKLNKHTQIAKLREIEANWSRVSKEERKFAYQILEPFMQNFRDDYIDTTNEVRTFNLSMVPVAGTKANPKNITCGTVSVNYGKEMKSLNTPDIAQYMTTKLADTKTVDITNGSTPANLRLNDPTANFCRGNFINGLTKAKDGFTPYEYKPVYDANGKFVSDNLEEVVKAKKANLKWLLDTLGNAYETSSQPGLTQMFFTQNQISGDNASVIGHLSKYKEGDMLLMGWGRPDPQKGYPSTFQAFLDFLKDPNIDKEVKSHTKLIVGAGVWEDNARDYKWVKDIIRQIEELDGGIYKGNAMYVNGFFPNRLVGCATHSIFTSRYEPCGITPLESFAAGTPVISTRTGGAPDFISATRGYLTKNPYLVNIDPSKLENVSSEEIGNAIDSERMLKNAAEVKECIKDAVSDYNLKPEEGKVSKYASMVRDGLQQKIDWHENAAYNGGKSANERYMTEVFEVDKGMAARSKEPMKRLVSDNFGIAEAIRDSVSKARNKWTKIIIGAGIAIAAIGTAAYAYLKRQDKKAAKAEETDSNQTTTTATKKEDKPKLDKAA